MRRILLALILLIFAHVPLNAQAMDVVKVFRTTVDKDKRADYNFAVFDAILTSTRPDFGEYDLRSIEAVAPQERELLEVVSGQVVNVSAQAIRPEWENSTIPIRIPILKGLMGYRLFLVRKDSLQRFEKVNSLAELKKMKMGLEAQWSITRVLTPQGFTIIPGSSYAGLFGMLHHGRFDYFPRGINEIFTEFDTWSPEFPDMVIEPTLALYVPLPYFICVSPAHPELAKRMEVGLKRIMDSGVFDQIFDRFHGQAWAKASLNTRRIYEVPNPQLSLQTLQALKQYEKNKGVQKP